MRLLSVILLAAAAAAAEQPMTVGELQRIVDRIAQRIRENYQFLPNYVCSQTVERSRRPGKRKKFEALDTLRLDVALIGGKELYSWPGARKFDDSSLHEMVKSGAIGSGAYATHPHSLFLREGARFRYGGEEEMDGRPTVRLDFTVPFDKSNFAVSDGAREAVIAYHGSVWADRKSLDLVRLDTHSVNIPGKLEITASADSIHYQQVTIGGHESTLPKTVELSMLSKVGEFHNITRFEGCRQYVGESTVSFADPGSTTVVEAPETIELPARLRIEMKLQTPIRGQKVLAVGDEVLAELAKPVQHKGEMLVPKGARCMGRLTRLEVHHTRALDYTLVGIAFDSIETPSLQARFSGELTDAGSTMNGQFYLPFYYAPGQRRTLWNSIQMDVPGPEPNEAVFCVRSADAVLPSGLPLIWETTRPK